MFAEDLCRAFCEQTAVQRVPVGYAVRTAFTTSDGDRIGFYVIPSSGLFRLEDDGSTIPYLEGAGVDFKSETRQNAFRSILSEYECLYNKEQQSLYSKNMKENEIPAAAVQFSAMLLRLQDLEFMTRQVVENTFREDALNALHGRFDQTLDVLEDQSLDNILLPNYQADVVLRASEKSLAAIYIATSQSKVDESVMLHMEMKIKKLDLGKVILLLENSNVHMKESVIARAHNHLDALPVFRASREDALNKIESTIYGSLPYVRYNQQPEGLN